MLEVLDGRSEGSNQLRDLDLASVFARQAAGRDPASRVERDTASSCARRSPGSRADADGATDEALEPPWPSVAGQPRRRGRRAPVGPRRRRRPRPPGIARPGGARDRDPRRPRQAGGPARPSFVPAVSLDLPAWSEPFAEANRDRLRRRGPWGRVDRAGRSATGRVAGCASRSWTPGSRRDHPAVGGRLVESVAVERVGRGLGGRARAADRRRRPRNGVRRDHPRPRARGRDRLDPRPRAGQPGQRRGVRRRASGGRSSEAGASVANLSLSSRSEAYFGPLHELADEAYFRNVLLVSAANNVSVASYPSLYASVVSVAAHDLPEPDAWFYNPEPPVEFGALRAQRRRRLARRHADGRDRQQLRGAAHRRGTRRGSGRRTRASRRSRRRRSSPRRRTTRLRGRGSGTAGPRAGRWRSWGWPGSRPDLWSAIAVRVVARGALRELALGGRAARVEMALGVVAVDDRTRWPDDPRPVAGSRLVRSPSCQPLDGSRRGDPRRRRGSMKSPPVPGSPSPNSSLLPWSLRHLGLLRVAPRRGWSCGVPAQAVARTLRTVSSPA